MPRFLYDPHAYEVHAVRAVARSDGVVEAIHWPHVPESLLLDSGYIVDMAAHRTERLRNGGFRDYGFDGLARTEDRAYVGIQAKAYGPRSTITADRLGTFQLAVTFMREKNPASRGELIHTPEARIENRLRIAVDRGMGGVTRTVLPFRHADSDSDSDSEEDGARDETTAPLREYQERAVADIIASDAKTGLYVSPCGTGKTLVVGTALMRLVQAGGAGAPEIVVVASPLQASADQNAARFAAFLPEYTLVRAWSEAGATSSEAVGAAVRGAGGARVLVSTTFDTLPEVARACSGRGFRLVVDEAHNLPPSHAGDGSSSDASTSSWPSHSEDDSDDTDGTDADYTDDTDDAASEASSAAVHPLWEAIGSADSALLMTATPPARLVRGTPGVALVHAYSFGDAIRAGAICDYRIYIPEITPRGSGGEPPGRQEESGHADSAAAKAAFLASGMLEAGAQRCIVYCESVRACGAFTRAFAETCEGFLGVGCAAGIVTCETSRAAREAAIRDFRVGPVYETRDVVSEWTGDTIEERKPVLRVVAAVRILDEAIDVPECDSVFFTRVSKAAGLAPAKAVQRLCRAVRVHPSKIRASAFVWTGEERPGDRKGLLEMFSLLREHDVDFGDKAVAVSRSYDAKGESRSIEAAAATVADFQSRFVARAVTLEEAWVARLDDVRAYVEREARLPTTNERLGQWVSHQRTAKRKGTLSAERIAALEACTGWSWGNDDVWTVKLEALKAFVEQEARLPIRSERLGNWIHNQRQAKRKGTLSAERVAALEACTGWSWGNGNDVWTMKLEALKAYVEREARLPPFFERLGSWVDKQRTAKRKGTLPAERVTALEACTGWSWGNDDVWTVNLEALKAYVEREARLPPFSERLGSWLNNQRTAKKKGTLSAQRVAALEAFTWWSWGNGNDDVWTVKLEALKAFVEQEARLPTRTERLGSWVHNQRQAKRKGTLSAERVAALDAVTGFAWGNDDVWTVNLEALKAYVEREARLPPFSERLGKWVDNQRQAVRKGKLSAERVAALEACTGWSWGNDDVWTVNLEALKAYVEREARLPTQTERLGKWVDNQRQAMRKGKLSAERVAALEAVEGSRGNPMTRFP